MSTIVAISTPLGAGGIGIIRVSGTDAVKIADAVFLVKGRGCGSTLKAKPMTMCFGVFTCRDLTDKGYAVFFPAGKSFTGEDTVEFNLHGGVRILKSAVGELIAKGARPAEAGEFTKRAYLNGRMALSDAEGVADMINAESAAGVRAAYRLMQGGVTKRVSAIAAKLLDVISTLEASLDYPDEMEDEILPSLFEVAPIIDEIDGLLSSAYLGRIAKHGVNVVIAGEPNVGKSSLLNALLGEDRAIVTEIAGTTRDTVTGSVECEGVLINFTDTAGLRDSADTVESIGVERAKRAMEGADVLLYVTAANVDGSDGFSRARDAYAQTCAQNLIDKRIVRVCNKCDLLSELPSDGSTYVSARTGKGVAELKRSIAELFLSGESESGDMITSERHVSALNKAKTALKNAIAQNGATMDCVLVDLREGYDALGEITGATATEDVVDRIFSKFCVGK